MIYYPVPIHTMGIYPRQASLPETEKASEEVLSLPIWPTMEPDKQVEIRAQIVKSLNP